jgi:hypothetical protein
MGKKNRLKNQNCPYNYFWWQIWSCKRAYRYESLERTPIWVYPKIGPWFAIMTSVDADLKSERRLETGRRSESMLYIVVFCVVLFVFVLCLVPAGVSGLYFLIAPSDFCNVLLHIYIYNHENEYCRQINFLYFYWNRFYTLIYIHIFIYICTRFPGCDCFSPVILYSIYLEYTFLYHYKCIWTTFWIF